MEIRKSNIFVASRMAGVTRQRPFRKLWARKLVRGYAVSKWQLRKVPQLWDKYKNCRKALRPIKCE